MPFKPPQAEEAREKAIATQRKTVISEIEKAIDNGRFKTVINGELHPRIIEMLSEHSYTVHHNEMMDWTIIRW